MYAMLVDLCCSYNESSIRILFLCMFLCMYCLYVRMYIQYNICMACNGETFAGLNFHGIHSIHFHDNTFGVQGQGIIYVYTKSKRFIRKTFALL